MSPPADLAALWALVDAVLIEQRPPRLPHDAECGCDDGAHAEGWNDGRVREVQEWETSLGPMATAAQEELKRVEDILLKDRIKTREINILTKENREQAARLASLERIHHEVVKRIHDEADPDSGRPWLVDQVLTILESHPTQGDADRQRVHGPVIQGDAAVTSEASAQAARDLAYWRRRAEAAEARAVREGRDE